MKNLKSIFHINMQTNRWDEIIDFYINVCGFDQAFVISVAELKNMLGWAVEEGDDKIDQLTYLRVSPDSYLEISNASGMDKKVIVENPDCPFHHFELLTEDIEAIKQAMEGKGHGVISSGNDDKGRPIAWYKDPDDHLLKVIQTGEKSTMLGSARKFTKLFGIVLNVNDLQKSVGFYEKIGCEIVLTQEDHGKQSRKTSMRVADNQFIELIQSIGTKEKHVITPAADDHFGHISFLVEDIYDAACKWAKEGIHVVYRPFKPEIIPLEDDSRIREKCGVDRNYICWLKDPDGNWLEIMEELDDSWQKVFEEKKPF